MTDDIDDPDAEFLATEHIGNAINALAQAEEAVAEPAPMPPEVAERLDALIDRLTDDS
ncbi:hypothetical protein [Gordonia neofelifaecis]|uniref:Uncharacterized protein n=1 Tax=Gordonia neofelifaecis NRRL B-59395 TaxID=644548 RepID=F1YE58_9ACTN|nr:hypothetical protein [Gordonia neofelifaecis]EGD57148.1 hypothetical protein SCNU_02200 [Gordonia neofelifaecis NRRL B-59395]